MPRRYDGPHSTTVPERYVEAMGVERAKPVEPLSVPVDDLEVKHAIWADRVLRDGQALPFKNLPPGYQALVIGARGYVDPESWWRFDFGA